MHATRRPFAVAALAAVCLGSVAGASGSAPASPVALPAGQDVEASNRARLDALRTEVEQEYIIGPSVAGELGYRVAWQARIAPSPGTSLKTARAIGRGIFALETRNGLIRLRPNDGGQLWRVAVAHPIDVFRGAHWIDLPANVTLNSGRVTTGTESLFYLSTDLDCYVLEATTGSLVAKHRFVKIPSTAPLVAGRHLVYGTLGGQVVWLNFMVGYEWRANSLGSPIRTNLAQADGSIFAVSDDGTLMCLDEDTAQRRWARRCFGAVTTSPAVGAGRVFVAGRDQYLWCFNARNGAVQWKHFTQSPLETDPFPVGDAVVQYVPGEGLVCLAADSGGAIDGVVRWTASEAAGSPIGAIDGNIVLWNDTTKKLSLIEAARGATLFACDLPQVTRVQIVTEGEFAGDIIVMNADGRVERLTPKRPARSGQAESTD